MEVKPGYKQTEVGVIPEDWEVKLLGEIGEALIGLTYKPAHVRQHGTLVLRSSNIQNDALAFDDNVFVDTAIPERIMVQNDDVLICVRNGSRDLIGKSALLDDRTKGMAFGAFMAVYRSQIGKLASYLFQSSILKRQINEHLGATINQITNKSINSFRIPVPPLPEQRAIATALSDVDGLLGGLDRLIAKKRDLKQAAMQQLLTGQTRLPGFHGEWEAKRLGSIANVLKGSVLSKSLTTTSGTRRCVLYGELFTTYGRVISEVFGRTNSSEGCPSIQGDVLMPGSTTTTGIDLATASALLMDDVALGGDIIIIRGNGNEYDSVFLANYLTQARRHQIAELTQGITIHHLYGKDLKTLAIELPPLPEQTAIAEVLTEMDAELAGLEQRRDKTRALKQAIMQELLTGRTRLVKSTESYA